MKSTKSSIEQRMEERAEGHDERLRDARGIAARSSYTTTLAQANIELQAAVERVLLMTQFKAEVCSYIDAGDGAVAVSYVHRNMQKDGWQRLGHLRDFIKLVQRVGLTVQDGENERGQSRQQIVR